MRESTDIRSERQSSLPTTLAAASISSLVLAASWALTQIGIPLLDAAGRAIPARSLLQLIVLLLIALGLTFWWALYLRRLLRHPKSSDFDFDAFGGFYIDRKTGIGVCARCLTLEPPKVVHLMEVNGNRICNACEKAYRGKVKEI